MHCIYLENAQQIQSANFDVLPTDSLTTIFLFVMEKRFESAVTLQLVCRRWYNDLSNNNSVWLSFLHTIGFPCPNAGNLQSSPNFAKNTFVRATSPWLINRVRACQTPVLQFVDTNIEFNDYSVVKFYEGTHAIAYNKREMRICDISQPTKDRTIRPHSNIVSLCAFDGTVYYALKTQSIWSFPLNSPQDPVEFACCEDENLSLLFACDKGLISISDEFIKLWDMETKKPKDGFPIESTMQDFQMDWNHLYWTDWPLHENPILSCWDLNKNKVYTNELMLNGQILHRIHISDKKCSLIVESEKEDNLSKNGYVGPHLKILNLDLIRNQSESFDIQSIGCKNNPMLLSSSGLLLLGRDEEKPDFINNLDGRIPEVLELRDIKNGEIVCRLQGHYTLSFSANWSITIFQKTFLYVTENKIVKMTFPENSNKRSADNQLQGDTKRQRLTMGPD